MSLEPVLHIPIIQFISADKVDFFPAQDNQAQVCLVYGADQASKVCLDFLEKVFKAVNLKLQVQTSSFQLKEGEGFSLSLHPEFQQHNIWISFGVPPNRVGLQFENKKYTPLTFQEKSFLWADSPQTIMEDPNLKKALWVSLQKLFPNK